MQISENALVTLLLCSDIAVADTSPLSDMAYSALAQALFNESKQPSDLLNMTSDDIFKISHKRADGVWISSYITFKQLKEELSK